MIEIENLIEVAVQVAHKFFKDKNEQKKAKHAAINNAKDVKDLQERINNIIKGAQANDAGLEYHKKLAANLLLHVQIKENNEFKRYKPYLTEAVLKATQAVYDSVTQKCNELIAYTLPVTASTTDVKAPIPVKDSPSVKEINDIAERINLLKEDVYMLGIERTDVKNLQALQEIAAEFKVELKAKIVTTYAEYTPGFFNQAGENMRQFYREVIQQCDEIISTRFASPSLMERMGIRSRL